MAQKTPPPKSNTVLTVLIGVAVGALIGGNIGYQIGQHGGRVLKDDAAPAGMPAGMPPAGMPPPGMQGGGAPTPSEGQDLEKRQQIAPLEAFVAKNPKAAQAWKTLGDLYFDTAQPQKSVDAYQRAIELDAAIAANPDVITDQGVQYRALGQFDKALANFKKAASLSPTHTTSVFNQGIVYHIDLHDDANARTAFQKVLQMAPQSQDAMRAQAILQEMGPAAPAKK